MQGAPAYHLNRQAEETAFLLQAVLKSIFFISDTVPITNKYIGRTFRVRHAAPKSHFQSKEEFEGAIRDYVTEEFTRYLREVIEKNTDRNVIIRDMGRAFVRFFHDYPQAYTLIMNQKDIKIRLSEKEIQKSNYAPFQLFVEQSEPVLLGWNVPKELIPQKILELWALVSGLAGIYAMQGFGCEGDWMEMINRIIG